MFQNNYSSKKTTVTIAKVLHTANGYSSVSCRDQSGYFVGLNNIKEADAVVGKTITATITGRKNAQGYFWGSVVE